VATVYRARGAKVYPAGTVSDYPRLTYDRIATWSDCTMPLDLENLENAVERLREGLARLDVDPGDALLRDGVIQRFEFTYELSHKTLRRYLAETAANRDTINEMEFPDLIRTGNRRGLLLGEWKAWKEYRDDRARTSHTYNKETALKVLSHIPAFLEEATFLLRQLQTRIRT
jgi:nucleotidyltransferase substrate binding protein (TIGR01987 family)